MACCDDLSLGILSSLRDVTCRHGCIFFDLCVYELGGDLIGLVCPVDRVKIVRNAVTDCVLVHEPRSIGRKALPVCVRERQVHVALVAEEDGVPNLVQLVGCERRRQWEVVATSVSLGVLFIDSSACMEWLMYIAQIMNEEPHRS